MNLSQLLKPVRGQQAIKPAGWGYSSLYLKYTNFADIKIPTVNIGWIPSTSHNVLALQI